MKVKRIDIGIGISNNLEISYILNGKLHTINLEEITDGNNLKKKLKIFIKILEKNFKCYRFKALIVLSQMRNIENEFEIKKNIVGCGIEIEGINLEENIVFSDNITISQWASLQLESKNGLEIKQ